MAHKPVRVGFKIWCHSSSCCGYLCSFRLYNGKREDPVTRRKLVEKGLVQTVVSDLLSPLKCQNHLVYFHNFYTSVPLADKLCEVEIFLAIVGTINRTASFLKCLKESKPPKGTYLSKLIDDKTVTYCVFNDRWSAFCLPRKHEQQSGQGTGRWTAWIPYHAGYTSTFTSLHIHGCHGPYGSASDRRHTASIASVHVMGTPLLSVFHYSIS